MDAVDRRAAVLRAIVEEYVQTAQPVASQSIAQSRSLGVSSATVRNDMTQLEREGYIVQPHTSAGRIPTDQGYRYFVDHFTQARSLPVTQRRAVADFFASAHSALEDLLHETSLLLARITSHAAVIVGPQFDAARVRSAQLVALQPELMLAIAVLSNGSIEKEVISNTGDYDDGADRQGERCPRRGAARAVPRNGARSRRRPAIRWSTSWCDSASKRSPGGRCPAPSRSTWAVPVGSSVTRTRSRQPSGPSRLLEMLEQQVVVVSLVRDLLDQGVTVSIGSENDVDELRDCSLVLAPYRVDGQMAGTVGVLGPTRMDYQQALAAVAAVSQQLGRLLLG